MRGGLDNDRMARQYVWQHADWPAWRYDLAVLRASLTAVREAQEALHARVATLEEELRDHASLATVTDDVVKTSAIEGEELDVRSVRSSLARRLGVDVGGLAPADRHVDGVVEMVLDATLRCAEPLTRERLFGWHAALFPTGWSGTSRIRVGSFRDDATGPMQVVSGPAQRRRVHFEAPPADRLEREVERLLEWAQAGATDPPLVRAGLAHLWLVTLHPFDDGNGRVARAVGDLMLARADGSPRRFYSLSAQIQRERGDYYEILEQTQCGSLDVTPWLQWLLGALQRAVEHADRTLDGVLVRARFWSRWKGARFNERQARAIDRVLDGTGGRLTLRRWTRLAGGSAQTAQQDVDDLVSRGVLRPVADGGRTRAYALVSSAAAP